ncbi:uncharacterized protein [Physcomitrium patens]|uniref:uncharacterized protein n=1 Tax=Physcomitrium patens TaxID=3218 RepID=UPI0001624760
MALGTTYPFKVIIIAVVGTMVGIVASVMGFSAELKRISADKLVWVDSENQCYKPPNQTVSRSIMAGILLLASQIGFSAAGGCLCCNRMNGNFTGPAQHALKSLMISWTFCVVAVVLFFYGAGVSSHYHAVANPKPLPAATATSCGYAINAGMFAGGAVIGLLTTVSGVIYYLAVSRMGVDSLVERCKLRQTNLSAATVDKV